MCWDSAGQDDRINNSGRHTKMWPKVCRPLSMSLINIKKCCSNLCITLTLVDSVNGVRTISKDEQHVTLFLLELFLLCTKISACKSGLVTHG